jgi:MFS family permease
MRGPLAHAPYRWLLAARTISFLGNAIAPMALAFAVLDLTGSTTDLGIVVAARSVTNVALLLFGGVIADRLPRHLVLVGSSSAAAITQGGVAALVLSNTATIPLLLVLGALNGAVSAISFPASAALTPQTVPSELLQSANTLLRLGVNGSSIAGAAVAGILVAAVGPGWGIAVDAATFAVAAAMFSRIRLDAVASRIPKGSSNVLADLRQGWGEFIARTWVWVVVAQFMVVNAALVGATVVLGPAVVDAHFGRRAWGLLLAIQAVGLVVGGLLALRFRPGRPLLFGVVCSGFLALPVIGLAETPQVLPLLPMFFLAGICSEQFGIAWDVSLQEHVPADRLARVYSYDAVGSLVAIPVGEVLVGPLAQHIGLRPTLLGCAVAVVVATGAALLSPSVRGLRRLGSAKALDVSGA